jgi:putative redox protein
MANIHACIGKDHYKTILASSSNTILADEPKEQGGEDLGFSPSEILASALGACTCITLRMYADRKNWDLDSIEVSVIFTRDQERNESDMKREITLIGALTDEERQRLLQIANQCLIHKTLSNPIHISTSLV